MKCPEKDVEIEERAVIGAENGVAFGWTPSSSHGNHWVMVIFSRTTLPIAFRGSRRRVWRILTLLTALSQATIWAQQEGRMVSPQEIKWRATKPQLVYVSESPDRYAALPCIIRLQDGTLLASMEREAGGTATTMVFIESADGGSTWSDPFTAKVPIANASGVMGRMNDGRVFMVCTQWHGKDNNVREYVGRLSDGRPTEAYENYRIRTSMWIVYSEDKGRTWTNPQKVDYGPLLGAWVWSGGRPLQLPDDTLLIPVAGYLSMEDMSGILLSSGVVRSANAGKSWSLSVAGSTDKSEGLIFSEPAMALLRDGRVVILMRTESRVKDRSLRRKDHGLYRAVSRNGGQTWSSPIRVLAGTHCSIIQLGDGNLLCGTHPPIRAAVSQDVGQTWSGLEPWFAGRESAEGWYSNLEYVDEDTAVAMIKDAPRHERIWVCRVERVR